VTVARLAEPAAQTSSTNWNVVVFLAADQNSDGNRQYSETVKPNCNLNRIEVFLRAVAINHISQIQPSCPSDERPLARYGWLATSKQVRVCHSVSLQYGSDSRPNFIPGRSFATNFSGKDQEQRAEHLLL